MYREIHSRQRDRTASAAPRTVRQAAPIAALLIAVLLTVLVVAGPVAAADAATYKLVDIKKYYVPGENPTADASVRIDSLNYDSRGGSIEFTHRSIATSGDCVGKVQHFKFSWVFNKDVGTLSGREGDPLVVTSTKWEGDSGTPCLDENPFVWIKSGGIWGKGPNDAAADYLFNLNFVNPGGENRVYFKGEGASNPTISFNKFISETGAISINPYLRIPYSNTLGPSLSVVYVYQKVPDAPTVTGTTAPQTTVATTTTVPPATTASSTVVVASTSAATSRPTNAPSTVTTTRSTPATTAATTTSGGGGSCSWAGTWDTNFGQMTLSEATGFVTGTYAFDDGTINGAVSGNQLTGSWAEQPSYKPPNDSGGFALTISGDCNSFTGTWGYGSASTGGGIWQGTRSGTRSTAAVTSPTTMATTAPTTAAPTTTTLSVTRGAITTVTTRGGSQTPLPLEVVLASLAIGAGLVAFGRKKS